MGDQMIFQRCEIKYLLRREQKELLLQAMKPYMEPDPFAHSSIRNIYYDTDTYRLIRRSLERPVYKEKLRLRSYGPAKDDAKIFVELKKKYRSIVYKRRLSLPEKQAAACFASGAPLPAQGQIAREIDYFRAYYGDLRPKVFLSYERDSFRASDGGDLRLTFDENILYRQEKLSLCEPAWGKSLLPAGTVLMELKTGGGIPMWLAHFLSGQHIFKHSFSKYGEAYRDIYLHDLEGGRRYA